MDPFIEPTDQLIRTTLLLSLQRALVGTVRPSLRAVTCGWSGTEVIIRYIFDGPIDPEEHEDMLVVGTEVIADFRSPWTIDDQVIRVDYPASLADHFLDRWAYMRKEAPLKNGEGELAAASNPPISE